MAEGHNPRAAAATRSGDAWRRLVPFTLALGTLGSAAGLHAQQPQAAFVGPAPASQMTAAQWAVAASNNEVAIIQQQGSFSVRYRERKIDAKGDTTRLIVETRQGGVARLIERDGRPLTAAEDAAERARLNEDLANPGEFLRHHRRDAANRADMAQMAQLMPQAMIHTFAPGQPQLPGAHGRQVVLDFQPNPDFHPPNMMAELLTGFAGRVWIDAATQRVVRAEGHVLHPVNIGFGILARIFPGGTVEFEQVDAGQGRWLYSRVGEHMMVRALVKTMPQNVQISSSNFELMPAPLDYQDAIRQLLAMQIPLR